MTTPTILVTGASGNLGGAVGDELLAAGVAFRAADIDARFASGRLPGAESIRLDFTDPSTFAAALDGIRQVFLLRPPSIARVGGTVNRFIDNAVEAGVEHIVFSSVAGAESNRVVPHHRIEQHLFASGLSWTVLRPGFFAQNLAGAYRADVRDNGRLYVPAGDGRVAFIDIRDLGELAASILRDPSSHVGQAYTLTGPDALTFNEVARLLSGELGRVIQYEPASILGYLRHLKRQGLPLAQGLVQTVLHAGLRRGDAEQVDSTLPDLLGRPANGLATYIADNRELWVERMAVA